MRTLSLPLKQKLQESKKGAEPVIILGVEWEPGLEILYSDRKINGNSHPIPIINEIGNFDASVIVSGTGASRQVPVTLSDIRDGEFTGHLKNIVDTIDVHKAKASVYLSVQGTDVSNRTLLMQGEINSPLDWDEGDRTLKFTIIDQTESVEAGFAIEDGDFPSVPEDLRQALANGVR